MRISPRTIALALLSAVLLNAACGTEDKKIPTKPYFEDLPPPLLMAHRGGADLYPEHTIYALEKALEDWDSDVLEIDLVRSADGHIMVIHDLSVDRTTDGSGLVADMTLAELKTLDAAHRFDPDGDESYPLRGQGHTIPTLPEVFEALPQAYYNLEIKDHGAEYEAQLHEVIVQFGLRHRVCWGSSNDGSAERLRAIDPEIAIYYPLQAATCFVLSVNDGKNPMTECRKHYDALNLPEGASTPEVVAAARANGIAVYTWTINDRPRMEALLDIGVDGIITDRLDLLRAAIDAR